MCHHETTFAQLREPALMPEHTHVDEFMKQAEEAPFTEQQRLCAMLSLERSLWREGFSRIAGVDEAGRGPLAGPIVAAAVVLSAPIAGLNDSKRLSATVRQSLYERIVSGKHLWGSRRDRHSGHSAGQLQGYAESD